jgi:hypothetical protein
MKNLFILCALSLTPTLAMSEDRLDMEGTTITGNRELPKVLYLVPWKRAQPGDFAGRPADSLVDEALAPVDRDVFRRELDYYDSFRE